MKWFSICALVLVLVLNVLPVQAQGDDDPVARIEAALDSLVEDGSFSGAVLVAQGGEVLLRKGYGMANLEWSIPNTARTKFRIGNLTMQFTAMAIVLLQERGSLSVDDLVCQFLEECPQAWQDITIRHLLTHTSGIPDYTNVRGFWTEARLPRRPLQVIERFIDEPLDFEPGEECQYSGSGYIVLGYLIEEVSGQSYKTFLQENLFEPLGMVDTGYEGSSGSVIEGRADGYRNRFSSASYVDMSNLFAASGLYSTVEDLYLWTRALHSGEVISRESWDAMLEAAVLVDDGRYGYGLFIYQFLGQLATGFGGNMPGFSSQMSHLAEDGVTIIMVSNMEGKAGILMSITDVFDRILLDAD